jgi:uncharacterized protein YjdB
MAPQTSGTGRIRSFVLASGVTAMTLLAACSGGGGGGAAAPKLLSIAVTPANRSVALGTAQQFAATGTYSNAKTKDLTAMATWSSSDTTAATVSNAAGSVGLVSALAAGSTTITASFGGMQGATALTVTSATLVALEVAPANPSIALGTSCGFHATGVFSDATTQDMTTQVDWESSDTSLATVSNAAGQSGLAMSVAIGSPTISATLGTISGSAVLTVTSAVLVSVQVTPVDPSVALGTQQQFTATGVFSDSTTQDLTSQAAWDSSSPAATVSSIAPDFGRAQSTAVGATTISATFAGIGGATSLTVTPAELVALAVSPTSPSIALGTGQAMVAMGTFTDATVQDMTAEVAWSSSDETIATVSNADGSRGMASSVAMGSATISASSGSVAGSTLLTVTSATLVSIDVTPAVPSIALGRSQAFVATGMYTDATTQDVTGQVTWSSSSASVATVSNADGSRGLATSAGVGTSSIGAALAGVSGSTTLTVTSAVVVSIEVDPGASAIAKGTSQAFSALGLFSDGTREDLTDAVLWASSDLGVAKISNADGSRGLAKGVGVGSITISATLGAVVGSTTFDVTSAVLVSIDVMPFAPSLAKGTNVQFSAVGTYSDDSSQDLTSVASWSSSDATIAVVSNAPGSQGLATGLGVGGATVTATFGGLSGSEDMVVTDAVLASIVVTPANPDVPAGMTQAFTAMGVFSDASQQDITGRVTWSSSAPAIAPVSNAAGSKGLASAIAGGTATITASAGGLSGSTVMTVEVITLDSIAVTPNVATLPKGYTMGFRATGNYSDGSSRDVTQEVVWTSSSTSRATVSNAAATAGLVTGAGTGAVVISATMSGVVGTAAVTVTNESLVSIDVEPSPVTLSVGGTQQLTATGTFSAGSVLDITSQVRWSSNNKFKVAVNNSSTKGLVTGKATGSSTVKAKKGAKSGTGTVNVL